MRISEMSKAALSSAEASKAIALMDNRLAGDGQSSKPKGVEVYVSEDLKNWTTPKTVLLLDDDCWARNSVRAPEIHQYMGKYYLFVTLTSDDLLPGQPKPPKRDWPKYHKRGT